jgi:hypothetical protein
MGFLKEYWGTQSSEFVEGFLAALDWVSVMDRRTCKYVIYISNNGHTQRLEDLMQEAVDELAELPELFSETIKDAAEEGYSLYFKRTTKTIERIKGE